MNDPTSLLSESLVSLLPGSFFVLPAEPSSWCFSCPLSMAPSIRSCLPSSLAVADSRVLRPMSFSSNVAKRGQDGVGGKLRNAWSPSSCSSLVSKGGVATSGRYSVSSSPLAGNTAKAVSLSWMSLVWDGGVPRGAYARGRLLCESYRKRGNFLALSILDQNSAVAVSAAFIFFILGARRWLASPAEAFRRVLLTVGSSGSGKRSRSSF